MTLSDVFISNIKIEVNDGHKYNILDWTIIEYRNKKVRKHKVYALFECRQWDLNPHVVANIGF